MNRNEVAIAGFERIAGLQARRCLRRAGQLGQELRALDSDEIAARCRRFVDAPKVGRSDGVRDPLQALRGVELGEPDAEALALAAEAFSRFPPAELEAGARLHPQQMQTAAHLLHGAIVQMDTGEGKTFAISTAALALLRRNRHVCIVTANPYLAARDADHTKDFWAALGISVGLALPSTYEGYDPRAWESQIVYTTLKALAFRSLAEDLGETERLLDWEAVLLDEADAVLLEQAVTPYWRVRPTDAATKDWALALEIAGSLDEDHVRVPPALEPSANLTRSGEALAVARAGLDGAGLAKQLLLLHDVELAYAATKVARQGHDYDIQSNRVVTIDPSSGWHTPDVDHAWVPPLEQHLGLERQPTTVVRHVVEGIGLLRRFAHVAGTSGTVVNEALEYAMLLGLPPAVVRPRAPRLNGRELDLVAESRERALSWVVEQVEQEGSRRPILIATDMTTEADEIAERLEAAKIEGVTVRAVSDETISAEKVFESAGQPGVTIVSTRAAGRGVDIPLSDEARENGGTMLLVISHAVEARLDRQLLGRVGRQGDPYSARFVNYPSDPVLRKVANADTLEARVRLSPDGVLSARVLDITIARAQRGLRRERLRLFASRVTEGMAREEGYGMLRRWRRHLGTHSEDELPVSFINLLADSYLSAKFPGLGSTGSIEPETIATELATLVGDETGAAGLIVKTTAKPSSEVRDLFVEYLTDRLVASQEANREAREELADQVEKRERAVLDIRLLSFLQRLSDGEGAPPTPLQALHAATGAARSAPAAVSEERVEERLDEIDAWLDGAGDPVEDGLPSLDGLGMAIDDGGSIAQAMAARRPLAEALDAQSAERARRSPRAIATETIDKATQRLVGGMDRVRFQVVQTVRPSRYAITYRARVDDLRREIEASLATEMCSNLATGENLAKLDELFVELEHEVDVHTPRMALDFPTLPPPQPAVAAPHALIPGGEPAALILEYVAALGERGGDSAAGTKEVVPLLDAFLDGSDLATMADTDGVATAYDRWRKNKRRRELAVWRRRAADRHVRGFLEFLHDRGLAATLPEGVRQRSRSWLRRARRAFATPGFLLAWAALGIGVSGAAFLAFAIPASNGFAPQPGLGFVDRVLTGGSLSAGWAVGPLLLALVGGAWCRWLIGASTSSNAGSNLLERNVAMTLLALGIAVVAAPWNASTGWEALAELGLCVLLLVVSLTLLSTDYWYEQMTNYQLTAGLAAAFAALSALPFLAGLGGSVRIWTLAACTAALLAASTPWRKVRIRALALRIDGGGGGSGETLDVPLVVQARLSVAQHAFALVFAWAASCVAIDADASVRSLVAGLAYLAVLTFWAQSLARSATGADDWQERMRQQGRAFDAMSTDGTLEEALASARRQLLLHEAAIAVVVVALGTFAALGIPGHVLAQLPVGMAAVFAAVAVLDLGQSFLRGLRSPLADIAEPAAEATFAEAQGVGAIAGETIRAIAKKMAVAIAVFVALSYIADAISVVKLIEEFVEWLGGLL